MGCGCGRVEGGPNLSSLLCLLHLTSWFSAPPITTPTSLPRRVTLDPSKRQNSNRCVSGASLPQGSKISKSHLLCSRWLHLSSTCLTVNTGVCIYVCVSLEGTCGWDRVQHLYVRSVECQKHTVLQTEGCSRYQLYQVSWSKLFSFSGSSLHPEARDHRNDFHV